MISGSCDQVFANELINKVLLNFQILDHIVYELCTCIHNSSKVRFLRLDLLINDELINDIFPALKGSRFGGDDSWSNLLPQAILRGSSRCLASNSRSIPSQVVA